MLRQQREKQQRMNLVIMEQMIPEDHLLRKEDRVVDEKQRIEAENYEETLRIQREKGQYAQHKKTQSDNLAAFQFEKQAEVGIAGAEALGQMGKNGAGDINLGSGGMGINPVGMMAGMALGGTIGKNVSAFVNDAMTGSDQASQTGSPVPPPIPQTVYHLAVNGKATGPYNIEQLKQLAMNGEIQPSNLVWTAGMASWEEIVQVDGLKKVLECIPPEIPTSK